MSISLNATGVKYAKSLIARGKVDRDSAWTFSREDSAKLLSDFGKVNFGKVHLALDSDAQEDGQWSAPVIKEGKVFRQALVAAQADASTREVATELLGLIDTKQDSVVRCDISDFLWDNLTSPLVKTPEGFLKGRATVTNIGVFPYPQADGSVRYELRCPEEVFAPESLSTLDGKPLTNDHPSEGVNTRNAQALTVGSVAKPGTDPYRVYCDVFVNVQKAVEDVQAGKLALSCGYTCDLDPTPGVWMGVAYTHIQRKIRYNHVALVDKGRAGDDAVLRRDGATSLNINNTNPMKGNTMRKIRLDNGVEAEADELVIAALDSAKHDAKKAKEEAEDAKKEADKAKDGKKVAEDETDKAKKELDKAKGELDAAKERVKDLEAKMKDDKTFDAAVVARVGLLSKARGLGADVKEDASAQDIKVAVIKLATPTFDAADKSADYLDARFDGACETLTARIGSVGTRQMGDVPGAHSDTGVHGDALEVARKASHSHLYGAWDKSRGQA